MKGLFATLALVATVAPAWAATQTVTLSVPGMTCAACPITIKRALTEVDGAPGVEVSFERKDAVVSFDDARTSVAALIKATAEAGYPSRAAQ